MSGRTTNKANGTMLDLWRPPEAAGDPIGCLTSTFTFAPGLFDEQCLARFLEIESEPNREDLVFLLERETRLGGVYAGVLADHNSAGVDHSFRWDVLPVRIHGGKQHAKISLLLWSGHLRIIVASANLTEPGYRLNFEVALGLDFSPEESDAETLSQSVGFLRSLLAFVPGAADNPPEIQRAARFLDNVSERTRRWRQHHHEPFPPADLQPIQNNFAGIRQQRPLLHNRRRTSPEPDPVLTPIVPPAKCQPRFTKSDEEP